MTFVYFRGRDVSWSEQAIEHLARSKRYPGAVDIHPMWTAEAVADEGMVEVDPYWASRIKALAMIGYSPTGGMVLLVLAYRDLHGRLHGLTAWPATGRALRVYMERNQL
ncbi:MAG: hypothetical protein BGO26_09070 [Actinobacteria bacterium 69-20]|nr:hypothetical protein [Actinomycetota bacterium]OJV25831.1 MAG: hypothetical protein BGO26_09070 [Actinobacteria bacterium 69-20]